VAAREQPRTERGGARAVAPRRGKFVAFAVRGDTLCSIIVVVVLGAAGVFGCTGGAALEEGRVRDALRVCPGPETVPGIDVSYYQGAVDWPVVAASGIVFAIARISDGTDHPDGRFAANWVAMQGAGLVRGAYQYFEPSEDPLLQAEVVIQKVGQLGPGDLPVALDVEVSGGEPQAVIVNGIASWMDRVTEGTGKAPLVYTAEYFWNAQIGSARFADRPLWVAQYGTGCPDLPAPWNEWILWQHSGHGSVPGIQTPVDLDSFNGTVDDLHRSAGALGDFARDASHGERSDDASTNAGVRTDAGLPSPSDGRRGASVPRVDAALRDERTPAARTAGAPSPPLLDDATAAPPQHIEDGGAVMAAIDGPSGHDAHGCACRATAPGPVRSPPALVFVLLLSFAARRRSWEDGRRLVSR
jgi:lysozyme